MALSYSDLQGIARAEKKASGLQSLPPGFYPELSSLLSTLDAEYRSSAEKLVEEFLTSRISKILRLASRTGEAATPANMTPVEEEMYGKVLGAVSEARGRMGGKQDAAVAEIVAEKRVEEKKADVDDGRVAVRILSPLPAIIGSDMAHYGPFEENQEARLPHGTAKILIEKGIAEEA
jgi:DNA replication initiation complex subunit (GINS family)